MVRRASRREVVARDRGQPRPGWPPVVARQGALPGAVTTLHRFSHATCGTRVLVYWHAGAPSFAPVIGAVAVPTKIPQVVVVALFFAVAFHPVPVAVPTVIVFPAETL